ncbi:hypothetical protein M378DRAFT_18654 [Amanita muscaria Koide BX008]|uniref:Uncharacterized protein n=1 Tax=Amanita muscaria (strain Koide BX008) TaxID=946122 RepID=A0A0C2W0P7_AMAMK|nr:hypothetical protein M378DRAFT_18654 [Amanita muscaria Koide BX008]
MAWSQLEPAAMAWLSFPHMAPVAQTVATLLSKPITIKTSNSSMTFIPIGIQYTS